MQGTHIYQLLGNKVSDTRLKTAGPNVPGAPETIVRTMEDVGHVRGVSACQEHQPITKGRPITNGNGGARGNSREMVKRRGKGILDRIRRVIPS